MLGELRKITYVKFLTHGVCVILILRDGSHLSGVDQNPQSVGVMWKIGALPERYPNLRRTDQPLPSSIPLYWKGLSGIQLPIPGFLFYLSRKGIILVRRKKARRLLTTKNITSPGCVPVLSLHLLEGWIKESAVKGWPWCPSRDLAFPLRGRRWESNPAWVLFPEMLMLMRACWGKCVSQGFSEHSWTLSLQGKSSDSLNYLVTVYNLGDNEYIFER